MPYKEKEIEKLYYSIGEVARMFDVNTSHIRFWSKQFDVIKPSLNKKGNRLFTKADLENLKKIYHLVKEKGFTLKGARLEMKEERKRERTNEPSAAHRSAVHSRIINTGDTLPFDEEPENNLVDNMAVMNSLRKIRTSLVEVQKELSLMEVN